MYKILFIFLFALMPLIAIPISVEIHGRIFDKFSGHAVPDAHIRIVEKDQYCISSKEGDFEFMIIDGGMFTLEVKRMGYLLYNSSINIEDSTFYNIYLIPTEIRTEEVIVTDNSLIGENENIKIQGFELHKIQRQTIAETLNGYSGVRMRSMGAASSRPVIRGLSNNRLKIVENANESGDLSATSYDHAVAINADNAESIDMIYGTPMLEYTSSMGGAVVRINNLNSLEHNITKIMLEASSHYESNNNIISNNAKITIPIRDFLLQSSISNLNANDMKSPDKTLINTSSFKRAIDGGLVYLWEGANLGFNFSSYVNNYGIPGGFIGAHPNGVDIEMMKNNYSLFGKINFKNDLINSINLDINRVFYNHKELESNEVLGAEFSQINYFVKIDFNKPNPFDKQSKLGQFGLLYNYKDFKVGGYVFTPYTDYYSTAFYYINNVDLLNGILGFGARAELISFNPYRFTNADKKSIKRDMADYAFSLNYKIEVVENVIFSLTVARSFRAPSIEELYSLGPHLAAYTYEKGNENLREEHSYNFDIGISGKFEDLNISFKTFYNYFNNFISFRNSGDTNWAQFIPIYTAQNINATIFGFEFDLNYKIAQRISVKSNLFSSYGYNLTDEVFLQEMPPISANLELTYKDNQFEFGIKSEFAGEQNRLDKFEQKTPSYSILGIYTGYSLEALNFLHIFNLSIDNLFDTKYFNHLSRIKSIMPEKGINVRLNYKIYY